MTTSGTQSVLTSTGAPLDVEVVRREFPALHQQVNGKPLVYVDNAASSQRPQCVIDAVQRFYATDNANVHRGVHTLSQRATDAFEGARERVRAFLNASDTREVIFTKGTTDAINLVAFAFGELKVREGDEIIITGLEHHSNIVPWQLLCERKSATLRVVPIDDAGDVDFEAFTALLNDSTRLVAMNWISNALGTITPVKRFIERAHAAGVPVLLDAAQATPHTRVDVQELDCDFLALSAHKMFGPTGAGVLYGKAELLEAMPPYQGGGDMILSVSFDGTKYNHLPYKFEAGTPNIAGVIGLGAAVDYIDRVGIDAIAAYEDELLRYGTEALGAVPGLTFIGTAKHKASVLSFTLDCAHPHDIGQILDDEGIAIRTGHHCAQPVMKRYGVPATARVSLAHYNTKAEIDAVVKALHRVIEVFS